MISLTKSEDDIGQFILTTKGIFISVISFFYIKA